jgi:hypothetical protein
MTFMPRRRRVLALALLGTGLASARTGEAPAAGPWAATRDNLMVVVRETVGANKQDDALTPSGMAKIKLPDGRDADFDPAWYDFIGDTHIRFVFDGPDSMRNATRQELAQFKLANADDALALALANFERVYGEPKATPWVGGVMIVSGKSPDLDSSYFLDHAYWRGLLKEHPEGLVVAVAKRGGLLFTPASDTRSVEALRRNVAPLHASSGTLRISSALFLFKDDHWTVFQPAVQP